ncbi:MAG: carbohydrate ABC transporter permease [Alkalispirochaetaceae bacterium]
MSSQSSGALDFLQNKQVRVVLGVVAPVAVILLFYWSFLYMRDAEASKWSIALIALVIGVGGIWALFASLTNLVEILPQRVTYALRPWVFVGPGVLVLASYIVAPALRTLWISFFNRTSEEWVGLRNYVSLFTERAMLITLRNTALWVILVPVVSVALGLLVAVMADRLKEQWEKVTKSLIFLPMAISFVGASVIWRFIYAFVPPGEPQIGILNALVVAAGGAPRAWWTVAPLNNFLLMVIMIWLQTGFAMVILSASVKGVPKDLLDAARIDGCGEIRVFFNVTIPYVSGTILTVLTTILFLVLKIFDIVWVMTSGDFGTHIVASRMYEETFIFRNFGRGAALSVFLFVVVVPVMIRNVTQMREKRK